MRRLPIGVVVAAASLVTAVLVPLARADTIYMRNGQAYEGKATQKDQKVVIEMPMGTIEVDAADVLHITPSSMPAGGAASAPLAIGRAIIPTESRRALPLDQITHPDPYLFTLMRNLSVTAAGTESYNLRQQIEQWRALSHDRKRRVSADWIAPAEFARRRQLYVKTIKEADDLARKIRPPATPIPGTDPNAERRKALTPALEKMDLAAKGWADPLIRTFLQGLVAYQRDDFTQSEALFRKCIDDEPLVAAFHQGRGTDQLATNHPLWALDEMLAALELRPDARELLADIQQAMKKVPGTSIKDPAYARAEKMLALYADTDKKPYSSTSVSWLMPGREWLARSESMSTPPTMPVPPYDRLVFRQALAAPIGKNTLLVDAAAVKDALEVYIRVDANTVAPAYVKRVGTSLKTPALTMIVVPGCEFNVPRILEDGNAVPAEGPITAWVVPSYAEMGSLIRKVTGKVGGAATDGSVIVNVTVLPGDSASPIFLGDGSLIGFLAAKTDIATDNGGPDRFVPLSQFSQALKQVKTATPDHSTYGRIKRSPTTRPATGEAFLVTAIVAETLE
jgi:hypothetical protein